jgi:orotate phosphoribosyltransferase-like protein
MATILVAVNKFGQRIGQDHPLAKLTNKEADMMLELRDQGYSYAWLAAKFDVSKSCARWICTGRNRSQIIERFVPVSVDIPND